MPGRCSAPPWRLPAEERGRALAFPIRPGCRNLQRIRAVARSSKAVAAGTWAASGAPASVMMDSSTASAPLGCLPCQVGQRLGPRLAGEGWLVPRTSGPSGSGPLTALLGVAILKIPYDFRSIFYQPGRFRLHRNALRCPAQLPSRHRCVWIAVTTIQRIQPPSLRQRDTAAMKPFLGNGGVHPGECTSAFCTLESFFVGNSNLYIVYSFFYKYLRNVPTVTSNHPCHGMKCSQLLVFKHMTRCHGLKGRTRARSAWKHRPGCPWIFSPDSFPMPRRTLPSVTLSPCRPIS